MDEQIKAFDKQAVDYALSVCDANGLYQGKEYSVVVKEKFAELIVKECADQVFAGRDFGSLDDYDRGWQNGRNSAAEVIKEHFGIK